MKPLKAIADTLYGYDYFISYSHADGLDYPDALKQGLEELGFSVFIDRESFSAGSVLTDETDRNIHKSSKVVLIGSPNAYRSPWVLHEARVAMSRHKPIVLIDPDGTFDTVDGANDLKRLLTDHIHIKETVTLRRAPSAETLSELNRSYRLVRREVRRWRSILATLAVAMAILGSLAVYAQFQRQTAVVEKDRAQKSQSRFLAQAADRVLQKGDAATAANLSLEALPDPEAGRLRPEVIDARASLFRALNHLRMVGDIPDAITFTREPAGNFDGYVLRARFPERQPKQLFRVNLFNRERVEVGLDLETLNGIALSPDGEYALVSFTDRPMALYSFPEAGKIADYGQGGRQLPLPYSLYGLDPAVPGPVPVTRPDGSLALIVPGRDAPVYVSDYASEDPGGNGPQAGMAITPPPPERRITRSADNSTYVFWQGGPRFEQVDGHTGKILFSFAETDPDLAPSLKSIPGGRVFNALSPSGRYFVTTANGGTYLWDLEKKKRLVNLTGSTSLDKLQTVRFSGDGKWLAFGSARGEVQLWDISTDKPYRMYRHQPSGGPPIVSFAPFASSAPILWVDEAGEFTVLDRKEADQNFVIGLGQDDFTLKTIPSGLNGGVQAFAAGPDGRFLAAGDGAGAIAVADTKSAAAPLILTGHRKGIDELVFDKSRELLISRAETDVRAWNFQPDTGSMSIFLQGESTPELIFPKDRKTFYTKRGPRIGQFDVTTGKLLRAFEGHGSDVTALTLADEKVLASGYLDGTVYLRDLDHDSERQIRPPGDAVLWLKASADGKVLFVQNLGSDIEAISTADGHHLFTLPDTQATNLQPMSDGRQLLTFGLGEDVNVWDAATGDKLHEIPNSHSARVSVSADGHMLFVEQSGNLRIFELPEGKETQRLTLKDPATPGPEDNILFSFTSSEDGKTLFLFPLNGELKVYDIHSKTISYRYRSPNGKISSASEIDGAMIAVGTDSGKIDLIDRATGTYLDSLDGHTAAVYPVETGPAGNILVSRSADQAIRIWKVPAADTPSLISRAKTLNLPPLNAADRCRFFLAAGPPC